MSRAKKILYILITSVLSYVWMIAMAYVTDYGITGIDAILPCLFALGCVVIWNTLKGILSGVYSKKDYWCAVPVSVVVSIAQVIGHLVDMDSKSVGNIGLFDVVCIPILLIFYMAVMLLLLGYIKSRTSDGRSARQRIDRHLFNRKYSYIVLVLIIILCYMPYYLTLFPGNMGKDTFESIDMCLNNIAWSNHHPVFYTLLMDAVIGLTSKVCSLTVSMGLFTLLQMILCACTYAYVVQRISAHIGDVWAILALLLYALHPVSAMFAMYLSKDVLFSCALVMLICAMWDVLVKESVRGWIRVDVFLLLTMLLRNNGIFIVVLLGIVLFIVFLKGSIKKSAKCGVHFMAAVAVFALFRLVTGAILDVNSSSFAESLSVPLQQVGYVIVNDGDSIAEADAEYLSRLMPFEDVERAFTLGYTDTYKFDAAFDDEYLNADKGAFMKTWVHMLPTHFDEYVKAYLAQTIGYWHYGETNTLCTEGVWEDNTVQVAGIDIIEKMTGVSFRTVISKLMLGMRKAPILCIFTSMAMQLYALIIYMSISVWMGNGKKEIICSLPLLLLWITVMIAAPASCLFRYMYPFFMMWPFIATLGTKGIFVKNE